MGTELVGYTPRSHDVLESFLRLPVRTVVAGNTFTKAQIRRKGVLPVHIPKALKKSRTKNVTGLVVTIMVFYKCFNFPLIAIEPNEIRFKRCSTRFPLKIN